MRKLKSSRKIYMITFVYTPSNIYKYRQNCKIVRTQGISYFHAKLNVFISNTDDIINIEKMTL